MQILAMMNRTTSGERMDRTFQNGVTKNAG